LKRLFFAALVAVAVLSVIVPAAAAPNIYGTSGLIEVPDDLIFPVGAWVPAFHTIQGDGDSDTNFFTIGTGILPNLSISGGIVDNDDSEVFINAKYRVSPETADRPSITIGVVDATSEFDDDPGLYILFAKNLTAAAEEIAGGESKPLRGYLGFGSGFFDGVFVGLEWVLTPKLTGMVEYLSAPYGDDDSHFNGGIRYALTNELRLDAALIDFDDLMLGISYNVVRF